eukprot:SAG31_NODE_16223_length_718_cov_0.579968_1_plen_73_part_00
MPYPLTTIPTTEEVATELARTADPRERLPFANTWVDTITDPDAVLSREEYLKWMLGGEGWLYHFVDGSTTIL